MISKVPILSLHYNIVTMYSCVTAKDCIPENLDLYGWDLTNVTVPQL